jgi:hypothetical protein
MAAPGTTGLTSYCAGLVQDFLCGRAPTPPTGFWYALGSDGSAASGITELTAPGYARVPVVFSRNSDGREANTQALTVGPAAGTPWSVASIALFDAATSGNCLIVFVPDEVITVPIGEAVTIDNGALTFSFAITT